MKSKNKQRGILFFLACGFFLSCDKSKTEIPDTPETVTTEIASGLPSNPKKINGYFYASCRSTFYNFGTPYRNYTQFAGFGDPARNLLTNYSHEMDQRQFGFGGQGNTENVNAGEISFNNSDLPSGGGVNYQNFESTSSGGFNYSCNWVMSGNGSFVGIQVSVPRSYPKVKEPEQNSVVNFTLYANSDFTYDISSNVSNHDSVCVKISNSSGSLSGGIKKTVPAGVSSVTFTKGELGSFLSTTSYGVMTVMAYNYSHKTERNKVYVFELSSKVERPFTVMN